VDVDPVLDALAAVRSGLPVELERERALLRRLDAVTAARDRGRSWSSVAGDASLAVVPELTALQESLGAASVSTRRALAGALIGEGLTITEVGRQFGVSRQRIAALLTGG
jgi:hypothetical protein